MCSVQMQGSNVYVTNVAPGPIITNADVNALLADGSRYENLGSVLGKSGIE